MKKTFGLGPSGTLMGEGTPKICIPIVAETVEEIRKKAEEISLLPAEVVEWRADFYEDIFVEGKLEEILSMLPCDSEKSGASLYIPQCGRGRTPDGGKRNLLSAE